MNSKVHTHHTAYPQEHYIWLSLQCPRHIIIIHFHFYFIYLRLDWLAGWQNEWMTEWLADWHWQADTLTGRLLLVWEIGKEAMDKAARIEWKMCMYEQAYIYVYELSICMYREETLNWSVLKADVLFIFWTLKAFHSSL